MFKFSRGVELWRKVVPMVRKDNFVSTIRLASGSPVVGELSSSYRVVVVGGGSGGCSTAARLCRLLPGAKQVAVIEPSDVHAYQPLWTLVGAGAAKMSDSFSPMSKVLPSSCDWINQKATEFRPKENTVITEGGDKIQYDYLVVAMGIQLDYGAIPGLVEALQHDPQVCSNYSAAYCRKTFPAMQNFKSGNAVFTFPNSLIKCAGAAQKIMYLTEEYLRKTGKRDKADVIFNTSLGVIFGVKKYADALYKVVKRQNIRVNHRTNLTEVKHDSREAVFENLDSGEKTTFEYSMLHAVPPMSAPDILKSSPLVDDSGFMNVDKSTLQHLHYGNVFGLGDCTNLPTSKTGAAVAAQNKILVHNIVQVMKGKTGEKAYDGYTSCPLITGRGKCILAEFDYDGQPLETFPIDQGKERLTMYMLKSQFMPRMYWQMLLRGRWGGPKIVRKLAHLGMGR